MEKERERERDELRENGRTDAAARSNQSPALFMRIVVTYGNLSPVELSKARCSRRAYREVDIQRPPSERRQKSRRGGERAFTGNR